MGGLTFRTPGRDGEPPLDTPRMSPEVYIKLREKYLDLLSTRFYQLAICPIESPEKKSYGDIDILVEGPRYPFEVQDLAGALEAQRYSHETAGPTTNFAIPDTEREGEEDVVVYRQLDVHVCRPGTLDWEVFTKSHGDMWNILGSMGRFYGVTVNDRGCHLRIPEIEPVDRKHSLLHLTSDPAEALALFGLDVDSYQRGFQTVDEMFDYISSTRFFRHGAFENTEEKRRDRQRMSQRPVFRRWVTEYLPKHTDMPIRNPELTRDDILEESLDKFQKRPEYDAKLAEWKAKAAEGNLWKRIAAAIPLEGDKLNLVIRGLRRKFNGAAVLDGEGDEAAEPGPDLQFRLPGGELDEDRLVEWVKENWEHVKIEERQRVKKGKAERKAAREAGGVASEA
ncbi:hypothetical protein FGG08_000081 [Glutinoglossum americanum]|uniref:Uncharacterized protein n=1 Tax=Glutinoglossum americanum TaxID=1670608 RepID=A0A9P8IE02_9PEZI|nr:hypothetical protein FGG08_000081 [Glutinoglossum americanum]